MILLEFSCKTDYQLITRQSKRNLKNLLFISGKGTSWKNGLVGSKISGRNWKTWGKWIQTQSRGSRSQDIMRWIKEEQDRGREEERSSIVRVSEEYVEARRRSST